MRKADNLTTILGHCHVNWEPLLPGTLWAPRVCNGTDFYWREDIGSGRARVFGTQNLLNF